MNLIATNFFFYVIYIVDGTELGRFGRNKDSGIETGNIIHAMQVLFHLNHF